MLKLLKNSKIFFLFLILIIIFSYYIDYFSEPLLMCNDIFFDMDTAEVFLQSKGLYLNLDTLKHPIPYLIFYLLNMFQLLIFKLTYINFNIHNIFPALNILLMHSLLSRISKNTYANIFFTIIFAFSFVNLTVGSFPETYAASLCFILLYLNFFYQKKLNLMQHRMRICCSIILGFCSAPLLSFSLIGQIEYFKKKKIESSLSIIASIITILSPYFIIYFFFPYHSNILFSYIDNFSSLNNLLSLKSWLIVFFNFSLTPIIGFGSTIQNEYNLFNILLSNYNNFIIVCYILLIATRFIFIIEKKINIETIIVYFVLIAFFVFFSPNFSAVFGIFILPLLIILFQKLFFDFSNILSIIFILFMLIIFYHNLQIIYDTPTELMNYPMCKNWGIKEGLGKIF